MFIKNSHVECFLLVISKKQPCSSACCYPKLNISPVFSLVKKTPPKEENLQRAIAKWIEVNLLG